MTLFHPPCGRWAVRASGDGPVNSYTGLRAWRRCSRIGWALARLVPLCTQSSRTTFRASRASGVSRLGDFYDLSKRTFKIFLIHALVFYARKNPTYQLVTHSIYDAHFVFSRCNFSLVEES